MTRNASPTVAPGSRRTTIRTTHRRRVGVALSLLLVGAACGSDRSTAQTNDRPLLQATPDKSAEVSLSNIAPSVATTPAPTNSAPTARTPTVPAPAATPPAATTPAATTPSTTPKSSAPRSDPNEQRSAGDLTPAPPCTLSDTGFDQILVFGNSTDYTFGPDDFVEMVAWPELLTVQDRVGLLSGVAIRNEAQRGQTMGDWDAWGPDPRLRLNTYAATVLDAIEPTRRGTTLALVAPSFIDLQESDADVDRAISDLSVILGTLESYGLHTLVLPMNYVSTNLNDRLPELNPAIERFNRELSRLGLVAAPLLESPLRNDGPAVGGAERWYDDFPGRAKDGTLSGADGFHPDGDGQLLKADAVIQVLTTLVEQAERPAECA